MKRILLISSVSFMLVMLSIGWVTRSHSSEVHIGIETLHAQVGDPIFAASNANKIYLVSFFDYLVGVDEKLNWDPDLSVAYKWVGNPGLKTWTFWIKEGIRFHNGDKLTAEDVKFSMDRFLSEGSVTVYKHYFKKYVDYVEVAEPYKVVYHLKDWDPFFFSMLSSFNETEGMIMPKKYIEKHGEAYFSEHPIGSGPYRLVENVTGSYMKGEAVENHWRVGTPKFKYLYFHIIPEEGTRLAALKTGKIDLSSVSRERLKDIRAAGFDIIERPGTILFSYPSFQDLKNNRFANLKVRKALNLAINRKEILQNLYYGMGKPGVIAPANSLSIGYEPLDPYPYDPGEAKKLLVEAGYPRGFEVDVYSYPREGVPEAMKTMEAIAAYWTNIGLQTKIIPTTFAGFRTRWLKGTFPNPVSVGCLSYDTRIFPAVLYTFQLHSESQFAGGRAYDAKFDSIYAETTKAATLKEYAEAAWKVYKFTYDQYYQFPIVELGKFYATNPSKIKNWNAGNKSYDLNLDNLVKGR